MHLAVCWNLRFLSKNEPEKECRDHMVLDYSNIMNSSAILLSIIDTYDCGQSAGKSSVKS